MNGSPNNVENVGCGSVIPRSVPASLDVNPVTKWYIAAFSSNLEIGERIEKYNTKVYLVNTGWTGGPYGVGSRMKLKYTRAMVTAALNGTFDDVEYKHDEVFNVDIPQTCPNVPSEIMNPRDTWEDKAAYDAQAKKLAKMFQDNFTKKYPNMPKNIAEAGPKAD